MQLVENGRHYIHTPQHKNSKTGNRKSGETCYNISNTDEVELGPCTLFLFPCICAWSWFWWLPARTSALCASVLEPDFDLTLRKCQSLGQSCPLCSCQVLCCGKCLLKFFNLISGECCTSFLLLFAVFGGRVLFVVTRLWHTIWRCGQRTRSID